MSFRRLGDTRRPIDMFFGDTDSNALIARHGEVPQTVCWIDGHVTTRQAISMALSNLYPHLQMRQFATIDAFMSETSSALTFTIFNHHRTDGSLTALLTTLDADALARGILILSDLDEMPTLSEIRNTGCNGPVGLLPSQTTAVSMIYAAMRFVQAGGNFMPLESMIAEASRSHSLKRSALGVKFTTREAEVLGRLREGMPTKIIAYRLGLSESTVKIHIRNLMRKFGATNRTQMALYHGIATPANAHAV